MSLCARGADVPVGCVESIPIWLLMLIHRILHTVLVSWVYQKMGVRACSMKALLSQAVALLPLKLACHNGQPADDFTYHLSVYLSLPVGPGDHYCNWRIRRWSRSYLDQPGTKWDSRGLIGRTATGAHEGIYEDSVIYGKNGRCWLSGSCSGALVIMHSFTRSRE